jgi:hypothetical protein
MPSDQEWINWFREMWKQYCNHPRQNESDLWTLNRVSVMGENVGNLLRVLDEREKQIIELREMLQARGEKIGLGNP